MQGEKKKYIYIYIYINQTQIIIKALKLIIK